MAIGQVACYGRVLLSLEGQCHEMEIEMSP
jgi:hypothetical protein